MTPQPNRGTAETLFRGVFAHLGGVTAYARRRGSRDPETVAAEVMAIAWRKLGDVPRDDPRPWLFATARNLLLAEWRQRSSDSRAVERGFEVASAADAEVEALDPDVAAALRSLSIADREALLLVAWEDLPPKLAAEAVGISQAAFRVRLHRARGRFRNALNARAHRTLRTIALNWRSHDP
jgi:RNA polymerase sigma-70 factor (ECF subfamily)